MSMGDEQVPWHGSVAEPIVNNFREAERARAGEVQEEGDGFDDRLDLVKEFFSGAGANFKGCVVVGTPARYE